MRKGIELLSKPADMTWRDHLVELLHVAAGIEHALMVEYLYVAYSLGGDQVPKEHRPLVQGWQETILTIAREEMGHLLTLQNALRLLGAPITFDRDSYPWSSPFYPFPFRLARFDMRTLTHFVYAEMPPEDPPNALPEERKIYEEVRAAIDNEPTNEPHHHVGKLYSLILDILKDPKLVPESAFLSDSYPHQASWDEWGRGYRPQPTPAGQEVIAEPAAKKVHTKSGHLDTPARVIVAKMASRTEAIAALSEVASQGEAPHLRDDKDHSEPSHFERFAWIYHHFKPLQGTFDPARQVIDNPTTVRSEAGCASGQTYISLRHTRDWASLFNLRYRILLAYLSQGFPLLMTGKQGVSNVRGAALHRAFGEMYNIKTIAHLLMRMPVTDDPTDSRRAGPPFEMPYTLSLPTSELDGWRMHRDLLRAARDLTESLLQTIQGDDNPAHDNGRDYLLTLLRLDEQTAGWIDELLCGLGDSTAHRKHRPGSQT